MLYSPILSCLRVLPFLVWTVICAFLQSFYHFLLRRNFFIFYKIFFKGLVKIFGIKVNIKGKQSKKNVLFVSNHTSYLDIFVLGSNVDGLFVAKSEIDSWPFINKICALGRTIFVNRNDIIKVKGQMNQITNTLKSGYSVILFPEGTSSDGSKVLPFKSSLLGVIEDNVSEEFYLQPISISYSKLDGIPLEIKFRPFFAWFGNMDLVSHAWKFLGLGFSEVNVNFQEPKKFSYFKDRKHAAKYCHDKISSQISSDFQNLEVEKKIRLYEFMLL
jgi:1-acyl-sn-glycerol-3-phosphate acyltransferase